MHVLSVSIAVAFVHKYRGTATKGTLVCLARLQRGWSWLRLSAVCGLRLEAWCGRDI